MYGSPLRYNKGGFELVVKEGGRKAVGNRRGKRWVDLSASCGSLDAVLTNR